MLFLGTMWGVIAAPEDLGTAYAPIDAAAMTATTTAGLADSVLANAGFSTMDFFGLFNIFVGLMIVASILIFAGGLITWMVRLGTIARTEGIRIMEWGVVILFVLIVLLALVQFFQRNQWVATFVIAIIIIGIVVRIAIEASKGEKKEEK